jgi:hypothetical protein
MLFVPERGRSRRLTGAIRAERAQASGAIKYSTSVSAVQLGLNLGYLVGSDDPHGQLRLTQHAEALGFPLSGRPRRTARTVRPSSPGLLLRPRRSQSVPRSCRSRPGLRDDGDDRGQPRCADRRPFRLGLGVSGHRSLRAGTAYGSISR